MRALHNSGRSFIRLPGGGERQPNKTPATPRNGGRVIGSCSIYLPNIPAARVHAPGSLRVPGTPLATHSHYIAPSHKCQVLNSHIRTACNFLRPSRAPPPFSLTAPSPPDQLPHVSRTTQHGLRITDYALRITHHVSRFTTASRTGQSPPRAIPSPHTAAPWPPPATSPCPPTGRTSAAPPPPASPAPRNRHRPSRRNGTRAGYAVTDRPVELAVHPSPGHPARQ